MQDAMERWSDGATERWGDGAMERCYNDAVVRMRMTKPRHRQPFLFLKSMPGQLEEAANEVESTYLETASLRGHNQLLHICLVFCSYVPFQITV